MADNSFLKGQQRWDVFGKGKKDSDSGGSTGRSKRAFRGKPRPKGRMTKGKSYLRGPAVGQNNAPRVPSQPSQGKKKP